MRNSRIQVLPIAGAVGAEISGADLSRPLSGDHLAEIRQALGDHGVIFFRDQELSPAQHVAFAENFGPIAINATAAIRAISDQAKSNMEACVSRWRLFRAPVW